MHNKCINHNGGSELQRGGPFGKPLAPRDVNAPKTITVHTLDRFTKQIKIPEFI
jgi:hypothetical protein